MKISLILQKIYNFKIYYAFVTHWSFLDDTLKEMERNKQTIIDEPKNQQTDVHFSPGIRIEPTQPTRKKSTGFTKMT